MRVREGERESEREKGSALPSTVAPAHGATVVVQSHPNSFFSLSCAAALLLIRLARLIPPNSSRRNERSELLHKETRVKVKSEVQLCEAFELSPLDFFCLVSGKCRLRDRREVGDKFRSKRDLPVTKFPRKVILT